MSSVGSNHRASPQIEATLDTSGEKVGAASLKKSQKNADIPIENIKVVKQGPPFVLTGEIKTTSGEVYIITATAHNEARARNLLETKGREAAKVCAATGGNAIEMAGPNLDKIYRSTKKADQRDITDEIHKGKFFTNKENDREWRVLPLGPSDVLTGKYTLHKLQFYRNLEKFCEKRDKQENLDPGLMRNFNNSIPPSQAQLRTHKDLFEHMAAKGLNRGQADALCDYLECTLEELRNVIVEIEVDPQTRGYKFIDDKEIRNKKSLWVKSGKKAKKFRSQLEAANKLMSIATGDESKPGWFRRMWNKLRGRNN